MCVRVRAPARNRSIRVISPAIPPRCTVMTLEAIRYRAGSLQILNQLLLPHQTVYDEIRSVQDAYEAIKSMKVRSSFLLLHPFPPGGFLSRLPADPACPPPCAFIPAVRVSFCVSALLCSHRRSHVFCHMLAAVGLYFCFGCTCSSTHQLPTLLPLPASPPKNPSFINVVSTLLYASATN